MFHVRSPLLRRSLPRRTERCTFLRPARNPPTSHHAPIPFLCTDCHIDRSRYSSRCASEIPSVHFGEDAFSPALTSVEGKTYQSIELRLTECLIRYTLANNTFGVRHFFGKGCLNSFWCDRTRQLFGSAWSTMSEGSDAPCAVSTAGAAIVVITILGSFSLAHTRSRAGTHFQF